MMNDELLFIKNWTVVFYKFTHTRITSVHKRKSSLSTYSIIST